MQYAWNVRKEIDKFFEAPETWGDVLGREVTFLTVDVDNTYTRTGRVYDFRRKKYNRVIYNIVTSEGHRYYGIPRHHIRGIAEPEDAI